MKNKILLLVLFVATAMQAQFKESVGSADFSDWINASNVKKGALIVNSGDAVVYEYSDCNRVYMGLMRDYYGDAADWSDYAGVQFQVYTQKEGTTSLDLEIHVDSLDYNELKILSKASISISGSGWQTVFVPWDMFDLAMGQRYGTLQAVKKFQIAVASDNNKVVKLQNVEVVAAQFVALKSEIQGKAATAGETVTYDVELANTTNAPVSVNLIVDKEGWESMTTSLSTKALTLAAGESKICQVEVAIPSSLPQGIREKHVLKVIPNGQGAYAETITLVTAVKVPTPNVVFTSDKLDEVRQKVKDYDWAKDALAVYVEEANEWKIPKAIDYVPGKPKVAIFNKGVSDDIYNCAITYQMTGDEKYAAKCLQVLRRLTNEENGYPVTEFGGGNSFVAEGVFFQGIGRAYDLIRDCDLLTAEDHRLIEQTFRLYIYRTLKGNTRGAISNWNVAELTGALYCALCLQDWNLIDDLLYSSTGIYKQIAHGVMSDGWWYECAVGYNLWVASEFSEIAIALQPWGINLKDERIPIGTTPYFSLMTSRRQKGQFGMAFEKWGTLQGESVSIKSMWDAVIPFLDYRGVLPAVNDAKEDLVTGKPYELAYYLYRDPEYAAIINRSTERNLLYGVPDLPQVESKKMAYSAHADNLGLVQLRSQTEGREQKDKIQAALHYGSHGGHHGHFDRTNFISMMRYGRSFYNPEMFWYGYSSYLYKFLVQTSINKNMVVVDQKMQEPQESFKTMYYTGDMMQTTMVETNTRWSHPPYGGMIYSSQHDIDFPEKMWLDARSIDVPEERPAYGDCTDYTEPILQRRLMIMMDDYVVLSDYMKAEKEHTFDWLFQVKGFKGITADKSELVNHTGQMSTDGLGAAQFITDCDWYATEGTSRTDFEMCFGEGCDNAGARMYFCEEGTLKMGIHTAWPQQNDIMIGTAPESFGVNKQTWFQVIADNDVVLNDSSGVWILGSKDVDVDITGKKELVLTTKVNKSKNNTLFWGDAKLLLKDGTEVFVSSLPVKYENLVLPSAQGRDYYDGEVKIAGDLMSHSTAAMPKNIKQMATVTVDMSDLDVARFQARLGGDFPLGNEASRRKTMAVRTKGTEARYLSVIEPYEAESFVKSVRALSDHELVVELVDGRVQEITIEGIEGDPKEVKVHVKELKDGAVIREEANY